MEINACQCVSAHLQQLRWCGFWRAGRGRASRLYCQLTLLLTLFYLLQECVYAYYYRQDMDRLARVMFLLLCHVTSIVKQIVFFVDADKIDDLIAGFKEPLFNQSSDQQQRALRVTSEHARRFVRAYSGCAVLTCTLWIVFPILDHARGLPVDFPFWIPFDYSRTPTFLFVVAYSYYVTSLVGVANTTMDAFIATILSQCRTQLNILRMNFEDLTSRAQYNIIKNEGHTEYDAELMKLFIECLTHFNKIAESVQSLQSIFGMSVLVQFGIGGWILCMAAYKIVSLRMLSIEFASMTLFISCILTELFLYCYYGNEVTVESERMLGSIYGMQWSRTPVEFQRALVVAMQRAQRPLRPAAAAGRVVPLSLQTFLKVIKSSYTFYAVLRQTK